VKLVFSLLSKHKKKRGCPEFATQDLFRFSRISELKNFSMQADNFSMFTQYLSHGPFHVRCPLFKCQLVLSHRFVVLETLALVHGTRNARLGSWHTKHVFVMAVVLPILGSFFCGKKGTKKTADAPLWLRIGQLRLGRVLL